MEATVRQKVTSLANKTSEVLESTSAMKIVDDTELKGASSILGEIKTISKELKTSKEAITKPLNQALKEVRDLFRVPETNLADAEKVVKGAILEYHTEQQVIADKQIAKIENRVGVGRGHIKVETAMAKLADVDQPETNIQTEQGGAQIKLGPRKVRITNVHALIAAAPGWLEDPRVKEAIRLAVTPPILSAMITLPGTEIYQDKIVAGITG